MNLEPYLFFGGRCDEALEFYQQTLGAEVTFMMRFGESPDPGGCLPGRENEIMHANVRIGDSVIMMSDGDGKGLPVYQGFSLSLSLTDYGEAERLFNALCQEGTVQIPLSKTFWSRGFAMVTDRFGVSWMINLLD